jgi:HD domain
LIHVCFSYISISQQSILTRRFAINQESFCIDQAAKYAEYWVSSLGNRWLHVQGVVEKARQISKMFDTDNGNLLIAAAYLHDIGYAPRLKNTGFHPLDGAYYLRSLGYHRLASLVAHHSEAQFEARLRGLEQELSMFSRERSAVADALTYCDQTVDSTGTPVSLKERALEVFNRYGKEDIVSQSFRQALPYLNLTVARTQRRLRLRET